MKKTLIILSPFVLLLLYFSYVIVADSINSDTESDTNDLIKLDTTIGNIKSPNNIFILFDANNRSSSVNKQIYNYLSGLKFSLSTDLSQDKISIKVGTEQMLNDELSKQDSHLKLVSLPREYSINPDLLLKLEKKNVLTILYTSNSSTMCLKSEQGIKRASKLWNFGASLDQYDEIYLSYLGQKFTKLGSVLDVVIYSNEVLEPRKKTNSLTALVPELGMLVSRVVLVDERATDLYSTLRGILQLNGKLLLAVLSERGLSTFIPQAHKLGLSFEMGMSLAQIHSDEELAEFKDSTEELIYPTFYSSEIDSVENKNFIKSFTELNKSTPTNSTLRGLVLGEVVSRILSRIPDSSSDNFSKILEKMDGVRILSPSGSVMITSADRGLIQPFYVAKKHKEKPTEVSFLGDISPNPNLKCE